MAQPSSETPTCGTKPLKARLSTESLRQRLAQEGISRELKAQAERLVNLGNVHAVPMPSPQPLEQPEAPTPSRPAVDCGPSPLSRHLRLPHGAPLWIDARAGLTDAYRYEG